MYLTYEEYMGMGGSAPESAFPRLEAKARARLDLLTFGRIACENPVRENVRFCMFDMINAVEADENLGATAAGREIASMSNDGVSVSFVSGGGASGAKTASSRYAAIAKAWLANEVAACGVPLLYAGVCVT